MMKCVLCTGEMVYVTTSFKSKWGDCEITMDGLKAHRCRQCQRLVFEPEAARMIQKITADFAEKLPNERPGAINMAGFFLF